MGVMDRDGSHKRIVTPDASGEARYPQQRSPQWSPGSKLVYEQIEAADGTRTTDAEVCKVRLVKGPAGAHCLTRSPGVDRDGHFSPSGNHIVFVSDRDGDRNIYVMQADGSNEHRITGHSAADYEPEWSPNGRWILFLSKRGGQVDLHVVRRDGTDHRRLTNDSGVEEGPTWSP